MVVSDGHAVLEDLSSKNGTLVNDRRLEGPLRLHDGDVVRIGPARLVFRSAPASDPTKTAVGQEADAD